MATGTEILALAGTVSSGFLALCINRGLRMRDDKRPLAELLWYAGGLIPLSGVTLLWASTGDQMLTAQRTVLFVLGAAIGGIALLAAGEWIRPTNAQMPPIPNINGNCNNIGNNNFNCNIIQGNLPLPFGEAEKQVLANNVSKARKIVINVIPDGRAEDLAKRVFDYLKAGGYQIDPINHVLMASGPNGPPRGVNINNLPNQSEPTTIWIGYP